MSTTSIGYVKETLTDWHERPRSAILSDSHDQLKCLAYPQKVQSNGDHVNLQLPLIFCLLDKKLQYLAWNDGDLGQCA